MVEKVGGLISATLWSAELPREANRRNLVFYYLVMLMEIAGVVWCRLTSSKNES